MDELRLIDTFSGIGGFSYAAEKLVGGFKTVAFVECEPYCQKVLKKHWPNVPIYDDIKSYRPEPYSAEVVCAGFPCQDISQAGKQAGITKETRSGLFFQLMRIICLVRPKFIILENVAAILNNGLGIVLGELAEAGYNSEYVCIPASALGACHKRDRFWLVAYPSREGLQRPKLKEMDRTIWPKSPARRLNPNWRQYKSEPVLARGSDGLSNWIHRTKALGNSIVPQVAAIPLQRVLDLHRSVIHT